MNKEIKLKSCANEYSLILKTKFNILASGQILELVYYERHNSQKANSIWEKKNIYNLELASIILRRLPEHKYTSNPTKEDIVVILRKLKGFSFKEIESSVKNFDKFYHQTKQYLHFLKYNKIIVKESHLGQLLTELRENGAPKEQHFLDYLISTGKKILGLSLQCDPSIQESLCLVSLILFTTNYKQEIREDLCRRIADNNTAVYISFAYIEFHETLLIEHHLSGESFVSLAYLFENWQWKVEEKRKSLEKGFVLEINAIKEILKEGKWFDRVMIELRRALKNVLETSKQNQKILAIVKQEPWVRESLKRIFKNIKISTIERYLEARRINAYIITFKCKGGCLHRVIDCLAASEKEEKLEKIGVQTRVNNKPKYMFKQYTNSARIGIVPSGWAFEEFHQCFQHDLSLIVNLTKSKEIERLIPKDFCDFETRPLKDIEIILHRLGLSGRNYYGFMSDISKEQAIKKISNLFSDLLDNEEIVKLIGYEGGDTELLRAIQEGPITELLGGYLQYQPNEKETLDRYDIELRKAILQISNEIFGSSSTVELGKFILESDTGNDTKLKDTEIKAGKKIESILRESSFPILYPRSAVIVKFYLRAIAAISSIESS